MELTPILTAEDADDMHVISTRLQDAITTVGELKYLKSTCRFVALVSRFKWEDVDPRTLKPAKGGTYQRVRSALVFETVLGVAARNIESANKSAFLVLLAIDVRACETGGYDIRLIFSGDGMIRLNVEAIGATLADKGKPWRTGKLPRHESEGERFDMASPGHAGKPREAT